MQTATINGKSSIYKTPETTPDSVEYTLTPNPNFDFEEYMRVAMLPAKALAEEAQQAEEEWLNDPVAQAEYQEWSEAVDEANSAEYEAEMERQAEASELSELGESGQHAIAGHDAVWQAGGEI